MGDRRILRRRASGAIQRASLVGGGRERAQQEEWHHAGAVPHRTPLASRGEGATYPVGPGWSSPCRGSIIAVASWPPRVASCSLTAARCTLSAAREPCAAQPARTSPGRPRRGSASARTGRAGARRRSAGQADARGRRATPSRQATAALQQQCGAAVLSAYAASPGADVAGGEPRSRCRCGSSEPQLRCRCGRSDREQDGPRQRRDARAHRRAPTRPSAGGTPRRPPTSRRTLSLRRAPHRTARRATARASAPRTRAPTARRPPAGKARTSTERSPRPAEKRISPSAQRGARRRLAGCVRARCAYKPRRSASTCCDASRTAPTSGSITSTAHASAPGCQQAPLARGTQRPTDRGSGRGPVQMAHWGRARSRHGTQERSRPLRND